MIIKGSKSMMVIISDDNISDIKKNNTKQNEKSWKIHFLRTSTFFVLCGSIGEKE